MENLIEAGINEIAIVLGNTYPEKVKEHYRDGSMFNAKPLKLNQALEIMRSEACVKTSLKFIGASLRF